MGKKRKISFREFREDWEYQACVDLQKETWGDDVEEIIYRTTMLISQKMGGIASGAFDADDRLLGLVFGLTGQKDGRPAHWSHILAVREDARGMGLGRRLKLYQRELLLKKGVEVMYWTYDPMVARNAHLNLNRLGVGISEYVLDMYGEDPGGTLSRGIGTDRFIVEWRMTDERVEQILSDKGDRDMPPFSDIPVVNTTVEQDGLPIPSDNPLPDDPKVRVEVPHDILKIQNTSAELAGRWRTNTRRVFTFYLNRGFGVEAFFRDPESHRCFYVLQKEG